MIQAWLTGWQSWLHCAHTRLLSVVVTYDDIVLSLHNLATVVGFASSMFFALHTPLNYTESADHNISYIQ